ncbi:hypothetical protein SprV_0200534800 [Sparganum proliferum]
MTTATSRGADETPDNLVHRLRQFMRSLSPVPPRAPMTESYVEKDLDKCTHVFVRCDRVRQPLESPYEGPFRVLARNAKTCRILRSDKEDVVSVDRVKAAVAEEPPDRALSCESLAYRLETSAPKPRPRSYKVKSPNGFHRTGNSDLTLSELAIMLHGPPLHELRHSIPPGPTACPWPPSAFTPVSSPLFDSFYPSSCSSSSGFFPHTSSPTIPSSSSPSSTHSSSGLSTYPCVEYEPTNGMVTENDLYDASFTNVTPVPDVLNSQSSLPPKPTSRPSAIRLLSPPKSRLHSRPVNSHVSCLMPNPLPCPQQHCGLRRLRPPSLLTNSSRVFNISCACEDRRPPVLPRRRRLLLIEAHPRLPNPPAPNPPSSIKFTSLPIRLSTETRFRWRSRLRQLFRNLCCWISHTSED